MSTFRRVEDREAGTDALGILIPPGRTTVVILRPRALPWDLLLTGAGSTATFREIFRDEASRAALAIESALAAWADGGEGAVVLESVPGGQVLRCLLGRFAFIACLRRPGHPYEPHHFTDAAEAQQAVASVLAVLHPSAGSVQEVYCNMRHFGK